MERYVTPLIFEESSRRADLSYDRASLKSPQYVRKDNGGTNVISHPVSLQ